MAGNLRYILGKSEKWSLSYDRTYKKIDKQKKITSLYVRLSLLVKSHAAKHYKLIHVLKNYFQDYCFVSLSRLYWNEMANPTYPRTLQKQPRTVR